MNFQSQKGQMIEILMQYLSALGGWGGGGT